MTVYTGLQFILDDSLYRITVYTELQFIQDYSLYRMTVYTGLHITVYTGLQFIQGSVKTVFAVFFNIFIRKATVVDLIK